MKLDGYPHATVVDEARMKSIQDSYGVVPRLHAPRSFTFERTVSVSRFQKWCSANKMIFVTRATKDMLKTKTDNAILDQDSS